VDRKDVFNSPQAAEDKKRRGEERENYIRDWLYKQGIKYERDAGAKDGKKVDFLLDEPMLYDGRKICWIESKASFGDEEALRSDSGQLRSFSESFGPGLVVYWMGYIDGMDCPEGLYISDISVLEKKLEKPSGQ